MTFVVFSLAYLVTAAPDILPADAGEFQLAAALLGVAHPPGYPLYTLLGHLFIRLIPWGTPAYRLNLLSGLLAAGTLVLMARATRVWARRLGASPLATMGPGNDRQRPHAGCFLRCPGPLRPLSPGHGCRPA